MLRSRWLALALFVSLAFGAARADALSLSLLREEAGQGDWVHVLLDDSEHFVRTHEFDAILEGIAGISYCIDLQKEVRLGDPVAYTEVDLGALLGGAAAAWLLEHHRVDRDAPDAHALVTALQLSLWEVVYDEEWDFGAGRFQVLGSKGGGLERALALLGSVPPEIGLGDAGVVALRSPNYQDQIFIPNVPEPGTAILIGLGVAALAARRSTHESAS
ncbi:MAG: hypothetical protein DCC71_04145 [Proteobacteria bacterium]|nr:MAG: hypothetical protein DCC71_04145 [Pseudomonadota bacterium]